MSNIFAAVKSLKTPVTLIMPQCDFGCMHLMKLSYTIIILLCELIYLLLGTKASRTVSMKYECIMSVFYGLCNFPRSTMTQTGLY